MSKSRINPDSILSRISTTELLNRTSNAAVAYKEILRNLDSDARDAKQYGDLYFAQAELYQERLESDKKEAAAATKEIRALEARYNKNKEKVAQPAEVETTQPPITVGGAGARAHRSTSPARDQVAPTALPTMAIAHLTTKKHRRDRSLSPDSIPLLQRKDFEIVQPKRLIKRQRLPIALKDYQGAIPEDIDDDNDAQFQTLGNG